MGGEWQQCLFENGPLQILDGDRGKNYPKRSEFTSSGYCIFLNTSNVTTTGFRFSEIDFVSKERDELLRKGKLQRQDVILTTRGTVGNVAYFDDKIPYDHIRINSGMVILRPDQNYLDSRFLYLFLRSQLFSSQVAALSTGSAQPQLPIRDIKKVTISYPGLSEQKAIAHILGTLDDKIELNHQMNATLESMAQALFKSWFVDFDPVIDNALAAGNPIPEPLQVKAATRKALGDKRKPLPEEIQKQFPDSFIFSEEMGWIPEGWEVNLAQDIATITIGKTPPRKETHWFSEKREGNYVWVSIRDMGNSGVFIDDSNEYLTPESIDRYNVKVIPKDSVLLSFKLTLGRVSIALSKMTTNEAIAHFVSPKLGLNKEYIYCYLSTFDFGSLGSTSSIATAVNSKLIKAMPFIVPNKEILFSFEQTATEWFSRMSILDNQSVSLIGMRDSLLPKLLSGELRIPDAEKIVQEGP